MTDKSVDIIDKTELSTCTISLRNDRIFQIEMKVLGRELEEKDVRELTAIVGMMGQGKAYPILILIPGFNPIQKSASEYGASEEAGKYAKAVAIVVNSFAIRVGSNFFIKIFKPSRPTKMFNNEERAVEWLKTLRD